MFGVVGATAMPETKAQKSSDPATGALSLEGANVPNFNRREFVEAGVGGAISILAGAFGLSAAATQTQAAQLVKAKVTVTAWSFTESYDDKGNKRVRESVQPGRGFLSRGDALAFVMEGVQKLRIECGGKFPDDCNVVMIAKANNGSRGQYIIPMDKLPGVVNPVTLSRFCTDSNNKENERRCEMMLGQFKEAHLEVLLTRDPKKNAVQMKFLMGYQAATQNTSHAFENNGNPVPGILPNQVDFVLEPKGRRY
jgi:hypothetical protein